MERLHLDLLQLLLLLLLLLLLQLLLLLLRLLLLVHEDGGVVRSSLDGTRREREGHAWLRLVLLPTRRRLLLYHTLSKSVNAHPASSMPNVEVSYRSLLVSGRGQEHGRRLLSAAGARPVHHIAALLLLLPPSPMVVRATVTEARVGNDCAYGLLLRRLLQCPCPQHDSTEPRPRKTQRSSISRLGTV